MIHLQTTAIQVLSVLVEFFSPFCSEFVEQINVGAAKGWVRYLKEKDLSDKLSSAMEDGWLNLSVKITLLSDKDFRNALPSVLRRLQLHRLPKIDTGNEVRHQGTDSFSRTASTLIAIWQAALDALMKSIITSD